jgi:predicted transcriptional regulator of viral defense system
MREERVKADARVAAIAARQHGLITLTQLIQAGIRRSALSRRVGAGRLHRIHRGVYAVGHPGLSREGRWMAAVLACGDGAALSHRSAAELWDLLPPARASIT